MRAGRRRFHLRLPLVLALVATLAAAGGGAARAQEARDEVPVSLHGVKWEETEIDIRGNDRVWTLTLQGFLRAYKKEPLSMGLLADIVLDLEEFYRERGMPFVRVHTRTRQLDDGVRVTIRITEGPEVILGSVHLRGMPALAEEEVLEDLATPRDPWFGPRVYVESVVEADVRLITDKLRRKGFVDAVVWSETEFGAGRTTATVTFRARQGVRIGIERIDTEGNTTISRRDLLRAITYQRGEPFFQRKLRRQRVIVRELYADAGYATATVEATAEIDREAGTARVKIAIDEGRPYRVRRSRFIGYEVTSLRLLEAQLVLKEGERYSRRKVRKTTDNLYRLGIFEWVRSDVEVVGDDSVDVIWRVKERKPGVVKIGGGYGSFEGSRGALGVSYGNLFGLGKRGEIDSQVSRVGYRSSARYIDPRIFQSKVTGQLEVYLEDWEDPVFRIYRQGGTVTVGRPIVEKIRGAVRARREESIVSNLQTGLIAPDESIQIRSAALILTRDGRDAPTAPIHGSHVRLEWEAAGGPLGGEAHFDKLRASYVLFTPLHRKWAILALAGRAGWIFPRDRDELLPIQEQFFTGGEGTVRGWREKEIIPRDSDGLPLGTGGNSLLVLNVELRLRIWQGLWGAAFWDAGNVWRDTGGIDLDDLRHSPGVGLRYLTPVGPIRLDYGYKLGRYPHERPWELHLAVGFAF